MYTRVLSQKTAEDKLVPSYDLRPEGCRQKHWKELKVSSVSVSQSYTAQLQLLLLNAEVLNTHCALPKSSDQKFSKLSLNNFFLQTPTAYPPPPPPAWLTPASIFTFHLPEDSCTRISFDFQWPRAVPHICCSPSGAFLIFHTHNLHHILAVPLTVCSFSIQVPCRKGHSPDFSPLRQSSERSEFV